MTPTQFQPYGVYVSNAGGKQPTYRYTTAALTPVATATDVLTLSGSATKLIRITRLNVIGTATAASAYPVFAIKRTAANTGGTATNPSAAQADTNDPAATATLALYTANPSALGSGVAMESDILFLPAAATPTWFGPFVREYSLRGDKTPVLRGTAESLAFNFNGAAVPSGASIRLAIEWVEE